MGLEEVKVSELVRRNGMCEVSEFRGARTGQKDPVEE